jgi:phytoene synthase
MPDRLAASYAHCRAVARRRARNFYYSFVLLPAAHRDAMCAVYAFMRYCDDLSDEPGASRQPLERWRQALERAWQGDYGDDRTLPAFHDTARRFAIPKQYFHDMIDGVSSDLEPRRFPDFAQLYRYCYQVASVVGLTTVRIFEFHDPAALELAEQCGVAFQLTNIIRDVREDATRGRLYLPEEDLARFGVAPADLEQSRPSPALTRLLAFEAERAKAYYAAARPLVRMVHPRCQSSLWALMAIYAELLAKIERSGFDVLRRRIALSPLEKTWIVTRAATGFWR